jgi:hypothetical protein
MSPRLRCPLAALLAATCLPSCTFAGFMIGATIDAKTDPTYREIPPRTLRALRRGERIRVITSKGLHVDGRYYGVRAPTAHDLEAYLWFQAPDDSMMKLRYSEVKAVGIEEGENGWVFGMLVGALFDVGIFVAYAYITLDDLGDGGGDWNSSSW